MTPGALHTLAHAHWQVKVSPPVRFVNVLLATLHESKVTLVVYGYTLLGQASYMRLG